VLDLTDVVKHFRDDDDDVVRAIDGVSLHVAAGELAALYGPSGSGKTTLLTLVAGMQRPDRGTIVAGGKNLASMHRRDAARYRLMDVGFVRQRFDMLPGASTLDNAALKLLNTRIGWREARYRVLPLLERLGLQDKLKRPAERLSHGEKQRVMIARALSTSPTLLLADEPTGSLDSDRGAQVLELLAELAREQRTATLLVTHDPRAAAVADTVYTMQDGRLVEQRPGETARASSLG